MRRVEALLVLVLLGLAGGARAESPLACPELRGEAARDRKTRAARHYQRGQELYARGEYEESIPEFRATYCLVPVPEAVYNVAQAYERLVDYERAVIWFDAYLSILPRNASNKDEITAIENRVRVLRKLPARIRVATDPPGATITLEGAAGKSEGKASSEPLRVPAGTYTMRVVMPGFVTIEEKVVAEIGQPYTYSYRLVAETGTLRVTATPSSARILVDDRVVGTGRFAGLVAVGEHKVTVEAELRPPEHRMVTVRTGKDARVHVAMEPARPRNGKIELIIASTALGVLEGGVFVTAVTEDRPTIAAVSLGVGALGFLVPYFFLPREVPTGQTSLMIGGRIWGAIEGVGLASVLYPDLDANRKPWSFMFAGGSIVAGIGAGFLARRLDISAGEAALINSGGLWGTTTAVLLQTWLDGDAELTGPLLLGGLNLGLLAGGLLATQLEPSRGRVFLVDLAGLAGIVSGTALATLLGENDESLSGFALGGMGIGLVVGTIVTRGIDDDDDVVVPVASFVEDAAGRPTTVVGLGGTF